MDFDHWISNRESWDAAAPQTGSVGDMDRWISNREIFLTVRRPLVAGMEVVWGHDTGVTEDFVLNFTGNWTGTGDIENPGVADTERLALQTTEYMISQVVDTGVAAVSIDYNVYAAGSVIDLDYRHGATIAACQAAAWNNYAGAFVSLGYVQVRVTSTL